MRGLRRRVSFAHVWFEKEGKQKTSLEDLTLRTVGTLGWFGLFWAVEMGGAGAQVRERATRLELPRRRNRWPSFPVKKKKENSKEKKTRIKNDKHDKLCKLQ